MPRMVESEGTYVHVEVGIIDNLFVGIGGSKHFTGPVSTNLVLPLYEGLSTNTRQVTEYCTGPWGSTQPS